MAMAMALTNYIVSEQIPNKVFAWVTSMGITKQWQFLLVLNVFLYFQAMVMEGFSAILVGVPLLIPFAAEFGLSPFHLAMMFLLNLEIAYLAPPLGYNLFVTSFRFNRPMISLYRVSLPFVGLLVIGLAIIMGFPGLSTIAVAGDIANAKAKAAKYNEEPREAFMLECVQEDRNNPLPCTPEEKAKWGPGAGAPAPDDGAKGAAGASGGSEDDDLLDQMMGDDTDGGAKKKPKDNADGTDDDLLDQMLDDDGAKNDKADAGAATGKDDGDDGDDDDQDLEDMAK